MDGKVIPIDGKLTDPVPDLPDDEPTEGPQPILCPSCHAALNRVSWNFDQATGLILFYHDEVGCRHAVGFQLMFPAPRQPRIITPGVLS